MTSRWFAASTSASRAVPLYCAVIGPTFTLTMPRYSSPSTSCSCAPGRHGRDALDVEHHLPGGVDRGAHSEAVVDLHRDSNSAKSSGVSTSDGAPVPSHGTATAGCRRKSTRAPSSPVERHRVGPVLAGDQHRIAANAGVGRVRESRAVARTRPRPAGTPPRPPAAGRRARPRPRSPRIVGLQVAERALQARRDAPLGLGVAHDLDGAAVGRAATASDHPIVGDDDHHRCATARDGRRRARTPATGGRAAASATWARRRRSAARDPRRERPREARGLRSPRARAGRAPARGARGTRATRSGRRAARYRPRLRGPRRPPTRPAPSAVSTAVARNGVEPMLTSATCVPPFTRVATAPTIAQSCARRLNFSYAKPAAPVLRTWISVSSSSGASAVSRNPWKKSVAATERVPPGPCNTKVASSASSAAGRSLAGSPCATEPPIVPRCRTWLSPTCAATRAQHTALLAASTEFVSRSRCRVSAPMAMWSPASRTYERSRTRPTSTSTVGVARRSFMSGSNDMPPARNFASSPCSPISAIASARRLGAHVVERGGDHLAPCIVSAAASTDFTMLW